MRFPQLTATRLALLAVIFWCCGVANVAVAAPPVPPATQQSAGEHSTTALAAAHAPTPNGPECLSLGFSAALECGTCEKLQTAVHNIEIVKNCKACCTVSQGIGSSATFVYAKLQVGKRRLGFYPEVQHFVQNRAADVDALEVSYVANAFPELVLLDANEAETIVSIRGWKSDQISEFLTSKLRPE